MHAHFLRRNGSRLRLTLAAAVASIMSLGLATPAAAAVPDAHTCWYVSPSAAPSKSANNVVSYSMTVQCDGAVRRVDLTVELLYHGPNGGAGTTVNGETRIWSDSTQTAVVQQNVTNPGVFCDSGYYSGRATATVQYLSGEPEYLTRSTASQPVLLSCTPPDIPAPNDPPPSAVVVTNPGTKSMLKGDSVFFQLHAQGGSGSYTWAATTLPQGVALDPLTGVISGTVTHIGSSNVTVTATASGGGQGSAIFLWSVRKDSSCTRC